MAPNNTPPLEFKTARAPFEQVARTLAWMEPLTAWRALRTLDGVEPTLFDGTGLHPDARHAYLAFRPLLEVRITGHDIEERHANGALEVLSEDPLRYLRRRTEATRFDVVEGHHFTGGWVGVFGFSFTRTIEPSLPAGPAASTPDATLRLMLDAIVFDYQARTATLFVADLDGDREACQARADQVALWLAKQIETPKNANSSGGAFSSHGPELPAWQSTLDEASFLAAVTTAREHIVQGDLFQVNLATGFTGPTSLPAETMFAALQSANPSPYMALVPLDGFTVVSGSPELLFAAESGRIRTRPIAGTRKRGRDAAEDDAMEAELLSDAKEQAEHTMLVDLMRNDLARVCIPGRVEVPELMSIERYRHVMHLASRVEGTLRPETGFIDWLCALFPGGTVTGAPKIRACQRILELEPTARGPYTGSAGYLSWSHNAQWNILIRGLVLQDGQVTVHAGAGIVADSQPAREWKEAQRKAQAMLDAAAGAAPGGNPTRLGDVTLHGTWSPPNLMARHAGKRVLLIDNYDSFVHNLADYLAGLGASVKILRNNDPWREVVSAWRPTHLVLSPGPGWPDASGSTLEMASELHGQLPILGVCLGHQAISEAHGVPVTLHPEGPVHGRPDDVVHNGDGLFAGLPSPLRATRYHSLVAPAAGADWIVDAHLADGTIMALRHAVAPTFGLQFHPESICTEHGLELLDRFLGTRA